MAILNACSPRSGITYPETPKEEITDMYFGEEISDPYRWLENDTSQATTAWVKAQNKVTSEYFGRILFRKKLKGRLTHLADYEKFSSPFKKHGKYYFFKNDGLQNQSVLYTQEKLDDEAKILLDPNKFSSDGTIALGDISFSKNGKYLAYTISRSGSDWKEIYVLDLASGNLLDDHIKWSKFSGASWQGDGFYYSAYDAPTEGMEYSDVNENHKIYYHKLGEPQDKDRLVYDNPKYPKRFYSAEVSEDERVLFIFESGEKRGNALYMKELKKNNAPVKLLAENMNYSYTPIEVSENRILFFTNYNAPKYTIMEADISSPELKNWKTLIPETESVLSSAQVLGGKLILVYNKDAANYSYVYGLDGKQEHEIKLPTFGTVSFSGDKAENEAFYTFTSFTFPPTIFKYNIAEKYSELYHTPKVKFDPGNFTTEQIFITSKDGTKIPMFLTYKRGINMTGSNPVLLYGYGGFNVSLYPGFSTMRLPFLENGGIYAQVNLRGGGEYGEEWHIAGTKMQKQNVFDDFISAAEYLIREKYTNSRKLAIMGGSNGGLLVGAVMNQRPDLFKVAIPQVGVMDMLRYHKFTIGWNWASDYGTCEDSRQMFKYLRAYSPLHNIKPGTTYPATLITTADHDDRVVPAHSFKYAATLQAANDGTNPTLIRIESNAGHGAGKPISKILDEQADIYTFIMYNLWMSYK